MTLEAIITKSVFSLIGGLSGLALYFYGEKLKNINKKSLVLFPPFIYMTYAFLSIILVYAVIEFDTFILDPSEAFAALENHGFIAAVLKFFVAGAAICIAWQRSEVSEIQINMQNKSNNISNFYSIFEHIGKNFLHYSDSLKSEHIDITKYETLSNYIFFDPTNGEFDPSNNYLLSISKLSTSAQKLTHDFYSIQHLINRPESPDLNSQIEQYGLSNIIHSIRITNKDDPEVLNILNSINDEQKIIFELTLELIKSCGLTTNRDFFVSRLNSIKYLDIVSNISDYVFALINSLPIDKSCKAKYKELFPTSYSAELSNLIPPLIIQIPVST